MKPAPGAGFTKPLALHLTDYYNESCEVSKSNNYQESGIELSNTLWRERKVATDGKNI